MPSLVFPFPPRNRSLTPSGSDLLLRIYRSGITRSRWPRSRRRLRVCSSCRRETRETGGVVSVSCNGRDSTCKGQETSNVVVVEQGLDEDWIESRPCRVRLVAVARHGRRAHQVRMNNLDRHFQYSRVLRPRRRESTHSHGFVRWASLALEPRPDGRHAPVDSGLVRLQ